MADRREALKILGTVGATCAFPFSADELYGQHTHPEGVEAKAGPPKYFSPAEMKVISALADRIIPATDTPGAVAAGVPLYIDMVVSRSEAQKKIHRAGLAWLDKHVHAKFGKGFAELTAEQQVEVMTPLSEAVDREQVKTPGERFFQSVKYLTADGYYTSRVGMTEELGYKGGAVLPEYPECIHEH